MTATTFSDAYLEARAPQVQSIQGEQQTEIQRAPFLVADQDDVEEYVKGAEKSVLRCRQKGHDFPDDLDGVHDFDGRTGDNLLYRDLKCKRCRMVTRREYWAASTVTTMRGVKRSRWRQASYELRYDKDYLLPAGHGRMFKGQVRDAVMTQAMNNTRTMTRVLKHLEKAIA